MEYEPINKKNKVSDDASPTSSSTITAFTTLNPQKRFLHSFNMNEKYPILHYYRICNFNQYFKDTNELEKISVLGGSYRTFHDTPLFNLRILLCERLLFPYAIESSHFDIINGLFFPPRRFMNLSVRSDIHVRNRLYVGGKINRNYKNSYYDNDDDDNDPQDVNCLNIVAIIEFHEDKIKFIEKLI